MENFVLEKTIPETPRGQTIYEAGMRHSPVVVVAIKLVIPSLAFFDSWVGFALLQSLV
jgi:hypothetical protein